MAVGRFGVAFMSSAEQIGIGGLVFILIFVAFYNLSFGPLMWVLASELFPTRIRGQVMAITVSVNWFSTLLISSTFPSMLEFNSSLTYSFYAVFCLFSFLFF